MIKIEHVITALLLSYQVSLINNMLLIIMTDHADTSSLFDHILIITKSIAKNII